MLGVLNDTQIDTVLRTELFGRVGCHADGQTYVVPITYVYDGEYIYGHTQFGLKIEMMRKNPSVCFQLDQIVDLSNWRSVVITGTYEELDSKESEHAHRLLSNRLMPFKTGETSLPKFGMEKLHTHVRPLTELVTYRIKVEEMSGRFEKD